MIRIIKSLLLFFIFLGFIPSHSIAQNQEKKATAKRTTTAPKIDGSINDSVWMDAIPITDFIQFHPVLKAKASQASEVRILYDDNAIYVSAMLFDTSPDSILTQLGNRDDELNADGFGIEIDPYNQGSDAYSFRVTASGVQVDFKENDLTYNAVWQSAVKLLDNGWSVEMKIPYSAIRFPNTKIHTWGLQFFRLIRRSRERIQWAPEEKGTANRLVYWGKLYGLSDIKPPFRLSFTPYLSAYIDHFPYHTEGISNYSKSISGGLDLKYGIDESFTFDMTLLPDFSQVQSDNYVKNLSPFETVYDEQRPFFTEAVDLFQKGDLFYSRRIGHIPTGFFDVESQLNLGEKIKKNPSQTKLINASKISGKNKKGLAIGFLNAITDNTYALIEDSVGNTRKILTDPLSNYNIIVIDQTFKNNSDFYFINTNLVRDKHANNANVSAAGLTLIDKTNKWQFVSAGAISQIYQKQSLLNNENSTDIGYRYNVGFSKIRGNFQASIWDETYNSNFSANDMGITFYNNYYNYGLSGSYNIYEPFGKFLNMSSTLQVHRSQNFTSLKPIDTQIQFNHNASTKKYFSYWLGCVIGPETDYDYYEPRVQDRYYKQHPYKTSWLGFSSDYRKPFAFDFQFNYINVPYVCYDEYQYYLRPIFRVNDKLSFNHSISLTKQFNDIGYVALDTVNNIIFGNRNRTTYENIFTGKYMFKNDLSLSLRVRHYWSKGVYDSFFTLNQTGDLNENSSYTGNHDFNFNSLNVDLVLAWQFASGSNLSIVWKNAILSDENMITQHFFDNFNRTLQQDQLNSFSIKMIYYLDYNYLKSNKQKKIL